jgi:type II secretory pathway pseudopilin PulG
MKRKFSIKGFTVVELIVSVLLIAILGEITIPYFLNQRMLTRATSISAMTNAVSTTVILAMKNYRAQRLLTSSSVILHGKSIHVVVGAGFPTGDALGIGSAINIPGFISNYGQSSTTFQLAPAVTNCDVTYWPNTGQVLPTGC